MPSDNTTRRTQQRSRPTNRACVICHARKVRCDGVINGFPCTNCTTSDVECTVAERRKRKRVAHRPAARPNREIPDRSVQDNVLRRDRSVNTAEDSRQAAPEIGEQNNQAAESPGQQTEDALVEQHLVGFFSQDLPHKTIRKRVTYVGNELSNLNYLTRQRALNHHVYHYACDNPYVPRVYKNAQPPEASGLIPKDAFVLPPKHISDVLVGAFFESIYPTFPVIDKQKFLDLYHKSQKAPSLLLLQAVCLAGSYATKVFKNHQELKSALFRRAKALLEGRYEEDRVEMVQAALLLTWFSDGGDDVCANAWWWIGIAARSAIGLGMHRDVAPSTMTDADQKEWRKTWWCLVQFDCMVSLYYGRPSSINLDDCDMRPLTLEDFEDTISTHEATFVMQHSALCALISDLIRSHFTIKATKTQDGRKRALDELDTRLAEWFVGLPPSLRGYRGHREGQDDPNPLLLHLTYNAVLIQFHRLATRSGHDGAEIDSRAHEEICVDAASNIIQIFEQLIQQSNLHRCWFAAPSFLFTATLQVRAQIKSENPILGLKARSGYDSGLKSLRNLSRHWLFAASVWRLFRSNSVPATGAGAPASASPEPSPATTNSSMQFVPAVSDQNGTEAYPSRIHDRDTTNEMGWVTLADPASWTAMDMYPEQDRWQQSLSSWQSAYWSDPLAASCLYGELGDLNLDLPL